MGKGLSTDFQGKVAVVTGGALGIGSYLVREFARAGASVAFIDLNDEAGNKTLDELRVDGGQGFFFCGDVGKEADLIEFSRLILDKYNHVDYLVNNAMITRKGILSDCSYEDFNEVLRIGVSAPYRLTQLLMEHFGSQGAIVNLSSTRAFQSQKDTESYTAAKGGITALTHALAVSLSGRVRVNSIAPGWIDTGDSYNRDYTPCYTEGDILQHPSQRVGHPMDIVSAVFFLCDPKNSFVNGQNITVDGGMSKLMIYSGDHGWEYREE